jgi:hypothetical protein
MRCHLSDAMSKSGRAREVGAPIPARQARAVEARSLNLGGSGAAVRALSLTSPPSKVRVFRAFR